MAGETQKTAAVCLRIHPWSRTSHIVSWLTPDGPLSTIVKGAVRPKSAFLGQYDLNYTCEILYYVRGRRGLHPLRECAPLNLRENLRGDFRNLALAGYFRELMVQFAPAGAEAQQWYGTLEDASGFCWTSRSRCFASPVSTRASRPGKGSLSFAAHARYPFPPRWRTACTIRAQRTTCRPCATRPVRWAYSTCFIWTRSRKTGGMSSS